MNRIRTTLEYILVLMIILEFNTPYLVFPFVKHIMQYAPILILACLIFMSGEIIKIRSIKYLLVYFLGAVIPFLVLSKGYFVYLRIYIIMLPLMWTYLNLRKYRGITAYHSLFLRYSNIVVVLAVVSLIMWILCSLLEIIPFTMQIPSYWTQGGYLRFISTYWGIYFETQRSSLFGIELWRNTGIFNEGPMYNMILCTSLAIECFIRLKKSTTRIIVLVLTIITTLTTTGQLLLIVLLFVAFIKKIGRKQQKLFILFFPVLLYCTYIGVNLLMEKKKESRSVDIRSDSIEKCLEVGFEYPVLGVGLTSGKVRIRSLVLDEHSNSLFELFAYGGLYVMILYIGGLLVLPFLYYTKYKDLQWLLTMGSFFIIFSVTFSQYRYLTLLFLAWGLSSIDMVKYDRLNN